MTGGVCGIIGHQDNVSLNEIEQAIRYRGPRREVLHDQGMTLCLRHAEDAPVFKNDRYIVVWPREITGYPINGLSKALIDMPGKCRETRGAYSLVMWDRFNAQLLLARDHFGVAPLYYLSKEGALYFSSEIESLLQLIDRDARTVNRKALLRYLYYGYAYGEETLFEGIRRVPPGSILTFSPRNNQIRKDKFWNVEGVFANLRAAQDVSTAEELLFNGIRDSIRSRVDGKEKFGLMLSGGLDSGSIAAFMRRVLEKDVECYTATYENDRLNERLATIIGDELGCSIKQVTIKSDDAIKHLETLVVAYDDLVGELPASIATVAILHQASREVDSIMTGDGGDEIFCGYPWVWSWNFVSDIYSSLPYVARKAGWTFLERTPARLVPFTDYIKALSESSLLSEDQRLSCMSRVFYADVPTVTKEVYATFPDDLTQHVSNIALDSLGKRYLLCIKGLTSRFGAPRIEPLSARSQLSLMTPFFDHELFAAVSRIPTSLKQRMYSTKRILRYMLHERKLLPSIVVQQRKRGLAASNWLGKEFYSLARGITLEKIGPLKSLLNIPYLTRALRHNKLTRRQIDALLLLVLWHEKHFQ
jgi:asparagine synthase (glutamine-hydrolysing)